MPEEWVGTLGEMWKFFENTSLEDMENISKGVHATSPAFYCMYFDAVLLRKRRENSATKLLHTEDKRSK